MSNNVLSFVGNLGGDAEVRYLPSGSAVLSFSVAMGSGFGDKAKTDWVRVSMFGKAAESNLKNYLLKGAAVFVSGECSMNQYQAHDGTQKTNLNMIANICNLVGKKSDNSGQPAQNQPQQNNAPSSANAPVDNFDDSIPF